MQIGQKLIPRSIDFDSTPLDIPSDTSFFMKGVEVSWLNTIPAGGQNQGEIKPLESNSLYCSIRLPLGDNTVIGVHFFKEAVECYVVVHNTNQNHLIYRLEGTTGQCRIVYRFCEGFQGITSDPLDFFSEGRIAIKSLCRYLPDGSKELYKELLLANKKVPNLRIVVEDSIATNSFTTLFFTPKNGCCGDRCRLIKVGVPTPMDDINIVSIQSVPDDAKKQNTLMDRMIKVRLRHETGWNQQSEHGKISQPFFVNLASCSKDAAGLAHCAWIETKIPCPEIARVIIEIQTCNLKGDSGVTDGGILSDWKEYATIDLYDQTDTSLRWFDRVYKVNNDEFEIYNNGQDIRYKFCNNRECKIIAKTDIRDANPVPITSGTVAALGKGLVYGDNENGYNPISQLDKAGFKFEIESSATICQVKYSRIKVYAVIHNVFDDQNQPVWPRGDKIGFGGFAPGGTDVELLTMADEPTSFNEPGGYGQFFSPGVIGFRAQLAGTGFVATSKQKLWTSTTNDFTDQVLSTQLQSASDFMANVRPGQKVLIQEFDFGFIPCGKYYFRIWGHADTVDLSNTSTFYLGNHSWNDYKINYLPGVQGSVTLNNDREILIDTTNGLDYSSLDVDTVAVIIDPTHPSENDGSGKGSRVVKGYLLEDSIAKQPIELGDLFPGNSPDFFSSDISDHNGFYFFAFTNGSRQVPLYARYKCQTVLIAQSVHKQKEGTSSTILYASYLFPDFATSLCNNYWVTGIIRECGTSSGIAGVPVIMAKTRPVFTDTNGYFRVIAHSPNINGSRLLIFSNGGGCDIVNCECQPINNSVLVPDSTCFNCFKGDRNIGVFNFKTIVNKGFEHGSRVPIGIVGHDWLGRHTDIQDNPDWVVQIPTEQELQSPNYPRIKVTLPLTFSNEFCRNFKHLTLFTGNNPDFSDFFTWAADKVEFVDSAGVVNTNNPSKIKVWYRSLNEFNKLRGFNTNTTWTISSAVTNKNGIQVLGTDGEPMYNNKVGDFVEFIQNGDGTYLPPGMLATVEYSQQGQYFLIDYDNSFIKIKDGVKFKFKRPYECEINHPYYEYGLTIYFCDADCKPRDINGNIISTFYLDGFNAYMLPRQIPVVTETSSVDVPPVITQVVTAKTYPFVFEHHSPSNVWGDHCFSGGRIGYKNPYEGRKCNRNQLMLTGALNDANDGAINYLHYFSLADEFLLDEQGWGGINAIIIRADQQMLVICDNTTFSLSYNDNRAVVTADGYIKVPVNNKFSRPDRDDGFAFGCQTKDLNTIRRDGPIVMWLDSQKVAVVVHDFQIGKDVSKGIKSWLTPSVLKAATDRSIYFHACFDNRGGAVKYILTKYDRRLKQYTNDFGDKNPDINETVVFNLIEKEWEQMLHFTPEYFSNMYGDRKDTQLFSFVNGKPYAHHNAVNPPAKYLNYYGIQCQPYIGVIANRENTKVKGYTSLEVYCFDQMFISEKVETSEGQVSKVLEGDFEFGEGFWVAPFLCDTNYVDGNLPITASPVFDGDTLSGRWLKALFQPEPGYNGKLFLLTAFIIRMFPREKSSVGSGKQEQ